MRIAISGSQCIGKTTLCDDIIKKWPTYKKAAGNYRKLLEEEAIPHSKNATKYGQRKILESLCEEMKSYRKGDKVIFDRCSFDNIIYSLWSHSKSATDIDDTFISECIPLVKESMKYIDIVLFIPITKASPIQLEERLMREVDQEYIQEIDNIFKAAAFQHLNGKCPLFEPRDAPPIIEVFGSREERLQLLSYYLDVDGDLVETQSSILDPNNIQDMENLIRDQREQFVEENKDKLIKKGIVTGKYK